ncbi:hypothetical protein [Rhizobium ruizarguesonis]|uniref:hypothetical protein n=1 Tax=Rhizobium ruizarguesonis TaxID=2081791 RepID=UPI001A8E6583|nr:hypothetical protein [Rhizobium ruizarguesonis]
MTKKGALPVQLALEAKARSDSALGKVLAHKKAVTAKFQAGKISLEEVMAFGLGNFCQQAGVGKNFLNGKKYQIDVKPEIKSFIKELKKLAKERGGGQSKDDVREEAGDDLEAKFGRVCDLLHEARLLLHSKRRIIKTLSSRKGAAVVQISVDETS